MTFRWRAFLRWAFLDSRRVWIPLGVFGVTLFACFRAIPNPQEAASWAGTVFQITGLGTVAVGLYRVRNLFPHSTAWSRLIAWLQRFPLIFGRGQDVRGVTAAAGGASIAGHAVTTRVKPGPDTPLERRLSFLEEYVERLEKKGREGRQKLQKEVQSLGKRLDQERQERISSIRKLKEQLEGLTIGGLYLEAVGLLFLFAGVVLGTLPAGTGPFLAGLLGGG